MPVELLLACLIILALAAVIIVLMTNTVRPEYKGSDRSNNNDHPQKRRGSDRNT